MMYCDSCLAYKRLTLFEGKSSCEACGKVLDEDNFTEDPGFEKNLNGQSRLSGVNVRTIQSDSASRERTISIANYDITGMMTALQINGGDSISGPAVKLYTIALERGFTRGRRKEYVEAACLYISLREQKKPYLLIDLSEYLRVNVYVLGAVFLQLCKLLSLEEHPIVQKPVDPSLFIHRFTDRLFGDKKGDITRTALNIVASMKRDWIQTGRKPSGLCGAAIYIAALSHGHKCLKSDVIKVVHVCENTLTKRLIEFENTDSGSLTIEEFNTKAREIEDIEKKSPKQPKQSGGTEDIELRCEHKDRQPFAHGVCGECYADLVRLSGGIDGGSEPPAFARAEMERRIAREAAENAKCGEEANIENVSQKENPVLTGEKSNGVEGNACEEEDSDNFADIDDSEVECYFLNKEEQKLKEIVWTEVNKEYLEEQAAKKAAELAERKAFEANFKGRPEELQAALELAAASKAAVSKSRKERNQKRAAEKKEQGPPKDAKEATKQMLRTKRLSSKINYEELDKLFDDPLLNSENSPKKRKIEEEDNNDEIKRDEDNNNNEYNQDLYHEGEEGYEEGYEGHEGYEEGYYEDQNQDDY